MAEYPFSRISNPMSGKSNPVGLSDFIFFAPEGAIVAVPALTPGRNEISTIVMRAAVSANSSATPPVLAVAAGKFYPIEISQEGAEYKVEAVMNGDSHGGFKVSIMVFLNGLDAIVSDQLAALRNAHISLLIKDRFGMMHFIERIQLAYSSEVSPKRGYTLKGEVTVANEPPTYTGVVPL